MSDTLNKKHSPAAVIMKRELAAYFTSPVAYIVTALFLIIAGITFFVFFFFQDRAELRNYFSLLPILLSFFIPALTMRLFAEEKRSGSIETLMTLPVTESSVAAGKWLAAFLSAAVMVAPTMLYVIPLSYSALPIWDLSSEVFWALSFCAPPFRRSEYSRRR